METKGQNEPRNGGRSGGCTSEERLAEALAACVDRLNVDRSLGIEEALQEFPDLAPELRADLQILRDLRAYPRWCESDPLKGSNLKGSRLASLRVRSPPGAV